MVRKEIARSWTGDRIVEVDILDEDMIILRERYPKEREIYEIRLDKEDLKELIEVLKKEKWLEEEK